MAFHVFFKSFISWHTQTYKYTHWKQTQRKPAQTQVMCLLRRLSISRCVCLTLTQPAVQHSQAYIPILDDSVAGWPWSSEDGSQTDRQGEGAAIHLVSACQPAQTSLGKQSLARESCKHHRPEWHNPSNYLSSLDCGPGPYREAGCGLTAEHTNTQM